MVEKLTLEILDGVSKGEVFFHEAGFVLFKGKIGFVLELCKLLLQLFVFVRDIRIFFPVLLQLLT